MSSASNKELAEKMRKLASALEGAFHDEDAEDCRLVSQRLETLDELAAAAETARDVLRRLMRRENTATLTASANTAIHQINAALGKEG